MIDSQGWPALTEKHTIALAFLRLAVRIAEETFQAEKPHLPLVEQDVAYFLQKYEVRMDHEIKKLLDKLLDRKLV